jgi:beta-lactamase regulating signal transducer with metallopeptidase domain
LDRLPVARTRHALAWLGLVKFFLPLSLVSGLFHHAPLPAQLGPAVNSVVQTLPFHPGVAPALATEATSSLPWVLIMGISLWFGGVVFLSLWWFFGVVSARRAIDQHTDEPSDEWQQDAARWWQGYPDQKPALRFAHHPELPAGVLGWLRPLIIVPPSLQQSFDRAEREAFLRHEFQHIYRRDPLWLHVQLLLRNLLWLHPLVWWLEHRIRSERELIRDMEVLRQTNNPLSYLNCLLKASQVVPSPATSLGINGSPFARRIKAIGEAGKSGGMTLLTTLSSFILLATTVLLLCAAQSQVLAGEGEGRPEQYVLTPGDHSHSSAEQQKAIRNTQLIITELQQTKHSVNQELVALQTLAAPTPEQTARQHSLLIHLGRVEERLDRNLRLLDQQINGTGEHALSREEHREHSGEEGHDREHH